MRELPILPLVDGERLDSPTGPVRRWAGVRFARSERFGAPRPVDALPVSAGVPGPAPAQPLPYYEDPGAPVSEDCLNLTVWAPDRDDGAAGGRRSGAALPVVVWIYGGGFEHGANSSAMSDASALAGTGRVVAVALNYRTGVLGFLSLSHLGGFDGASNLGLRDVAAGLTWVHRHIAAFGGDPERVTVVGESAGAFLAAALVSAGDARTLLSRLVLFSGGASRVVPAWRAREMTRAYLDAVGASADPRVLRDLPLDALFAAQPAIAVGDIGLRNNVAPQALGVVDDSAEAGGLLAAHPMRAFEAGLAAHVPVLICSTRDEIGAFRRPELFDPAGTGAVADEVEALGVDRARAEEIVEHYAGLPPAPDGEPGASPGLVRQRMLTDWIYRLPAARIALVQAAAGGTAHLAMTGRADGRIAGHACDAAPLVGAATPGRGGAGARRDAQITGTVLDFATTGRPGWEAVPSPAPRRGDRDAGKRAPGAGDIAIGTPGAAGSAARAPRAEALTAPETLPVHVFGEDFDAAGEYRSMVALWRGVDRP